LELHFDSPAVYFFELANLMLVQFPPRLQIPFLRMFSGVFVL
jgi:hypothetical protein